MTLEVFTDNGVLTLEGENLLHVEDDQGQKLTYTRGDGGRGLGVPLTPSAQGKLPQLLLCTHLLGASVP